MGFPPIIFSTPNWRTPPSVYAYCPPSEHKNLKDCIEYVTRYVGSPVMAQSRIIDYNSDMDHVIWWYEDHETKEYVEVYES